MKPFWLIFSFVMLMLNLGAAAQDFAPVGAMWHYTEWWAFSGNIGFLSLRSVKDTVVQGKSCRRLDSNEYLCLYPSGKQYIHYSNDSLYRYNPDFHQFQCIAVFNAQKEDLWKFWLKDRDESTDTITVKVDSVNTLTINQNRLKQLFVTYEVVNYSAQGHRDREFSYNSRIVEKIGDVQYLFNFPLSAMVICDANFSGGLRCYEDAEFGFYSTGIAASCTYTGIDDRKAALDVKIFPNPTSGLLQMTVANEKKITLQIMDSNGRCLLNETLDEPYQADLSRLSKGLYIVIVSTHHHRVGYAKVIKK